jgi:hypothetical protein
LLLGSSGCVILGSTTRNSVVGKQKTLRQIMINPEASNEDVSRAFAAAVAFWKQNLPKLKDLIAAGGAPGRPSGCGLKC